ncbi:MAG: hypothetical protein EA385_10675 [Salinarimonadaceae bacterium]|nr:MAG: hypothetical protein EA385_10675 [Salinarimonadaceae bacterium]
MATKDHLIERVLSILNVSAAGQGIAAEDAALVDRLIVPTFENLRARRYAPQIDIENIPDALFEDLAECVAMRCAADFGLTMDPARMAGAEERLRTATADGPAYGPIQTMYF